MAVIELHFFSRLDIIPPYGASHFVMSTLWLSQTLCTTYLYPFLIPLVVYLGVELPGLVAIVYLASSGTSALFALVAIPFYFTIIPPATHEGSFLYRLTKTDLLFKLL
jgi:hypothetical protein